MDSWVVQIPWRRERLPSPVFWPGEFQALYTSWGQKDLDMTERLSLTYFLCPLELREGRGGQRPTYKEWWTKNPLHPGSHRALLGISISVAGGDWDPSLRQGTLRLLPLVGGIRLEARS